MGGRLRLLFVSHVFSLGTLPKIGGTSSSKYSVFFTVFYAANMFVWMDGRTDERTDGLLAGDMSTLLTLITSTVFSLSSNLHRLNHIIQYPYPSHPEIPTSKERLEEVHAESGFSHPVTPACIANVFITSF